jgi:FkbM family methyltransferase
MLVDPNRLTSQSALGRLVRLPLRLVPRRAVVRILSGPNRGARWRAGSSVAGCWVGTYEAPKATALAARVSPGMTVWDVGANAGYYTLLFSRAVGPRGCVVAFEPFAENADNLLRHVEWNESRNVKLVQAAVAAKAGLAGFEVGSGSNSVGHLSECERNYLVPTVSLDECVQKGALPFPDIVKMDIEGAEVSALEGASDILKTKRTTWYISLHGDSAREGCASILVRAGYRLSAIDGSLISPDLLGHSPDEIVAVPQG